jgi:hypothetical protein
MVKKQNYSEVLQTSYSSDLQILYFLSLRASYENGQECDITYGAIRKSMMESETLDSLTILNTKDLFSAWVENRVSALIPSPGGGEGGSDWTITDELYGDNIYNAKEIFIRMQTNDNSRWVFSHFICNPTFNETIGNSYQQTNIAFSTPHGMDNQTPYWYFDGWNLNITCDGGYSNALVAYKQ